MVNKQIQTKKTLQLNIFSWETANGNTHVFNGLILKYKEIHVHCTYNEYELTNNLFISIRFYFQISNINDIIQFTKYINNLKLGVLYYICKFFFNLRGAATGRYPPPVN